jgi:hypothetical protein
MGFPGKVFSWPSFPRKRESIFFDGLQIKMDSRLRGNDDDVYSML